MPLTEFQIQLLQMLSSHRNPNSYVAGGIAINRATTSKRYSNDVDFFHDTDEAVIAGADADLNLIKENGYKIDRLINQPSFIRAVVSKGAKSLKLEWVRDTAFRFFPVVKDELLGFRLHDVDLAVNKCLALANRNEVRDIIDLIALDNDCISLPAACWAACGKDPGFTPALLIDCMKRNSVIRSDQLAAESLAQEIQPQELKLEWLALLQAAADTLDEFPAKDLGCLYLDKDKQVLRSPQVMDLDQYIRHFGTITGSWPRISA